MLYRSMYNGMNTGETIRFVDDNIPILLELYYTGGSAIIPGLKCTVTVLF